MSEPIRTYRSRATRVEAIRWIDHATSCDAVYRFLGLNVGPHSDHELFEIPGGTYQNYTWRDGWILRYPNGRLRACSDATFTAEFELDGVATYAWGESVGMSSDVIDIPLNDPAGDWVATLLLDRGGAEVLRDMLDSVLVEDGGSDD